VRIPRKLMLLIAIAALAASAFSVARGTPSSRHMDAYFSRAVQVFPGNSVRVLGVDVGRVEAVENVEGSVKVTFELDEEIELPADVKATIVPVSLLGERYIQLFPAYDGGESFEGSEIPLDRTSVPTEQDELLRGLQDYFGELDPEKVAEFVANTAEILEGNGAELNELIEHASGVVGTLSDKRNSLADMIVQFNEVTQALSTRQKNLARLINDYNDLSRVVNENRTAVEGTIDGLNQAALQLSDLLIDHEDPLDFDIDALTKTSRTLARNVDRFAKTGSHATRLFGAASRAADYDRDWLRLGNQGKPLFELLQFRLRDRLVGVCLRLGLDQCSTQRYWAARMPDLFCLEGSCPKAARRQSPAERLQDSLREIPGPTGDILRDALGILEEDCEDAEDPTACRIKELKILTRDCSEAADPDRCRERKEAVLDKYPNLTRREVILKLERQIESATGTEIDLDDVAGSLEGLGL
jgi:phospholipid/cholesterol/gamma-HCH transport system substrate-binding protein